MNTHSRPGVKNLVSCFLAKSLTALLFIALAACNDNEENTSCLLTKSVVTYADEKKDETTYVFIGANQLIKTTTVGNDYTYSYEFTYDTNGKVTTQTYNVTSQNENYNNYVVYSYNTAGQLAKKEYFAENALTGISENEYNASGQVIKRQHYMVSASGTATKDYYNMLEYSNTSTSNVLKDKKYGQAGALLRTTEYVYDNKPTPWIAIASKNPFEDSENNITKLTRTEGTSVTSYVFSYEYLNSGHPSKLTCTNSSGSVNYTEDYAYTCN